MWDHIKALIGTLLLLETLGVMFFASIWAFLKVLHANQFIVLSGEVLAALGILIVSVPLYRLVLQNEREAYLSVKTDLPHDQAA